jgi:hypothetical protein
MLVRAKPWLIGLAILVAFVLAVLVVLAAFDVLWGMHELDKNAPPMD